MRFEHGAKVAGVLVHAAVSNVRVAFHHHALRHTDGASGLEGAPKLDFGGTIIFQLALILVTIFLLEELRILAQAWMTL